MIFSKGRRAGRVLRNEFTAQNKGLGGLGYSMTGMENSPPSLMPDGQREVIVFVRV